MSAPIIQFKRDLLAAAKASFSVDVWKFLLGPGSCRSTYSSSFVINENTVAEFLYTRFV